MSRTDELKAELKLAELEEALAEAKKNDDPKKLRKVKHALREARQTVREGRDG